MTTRFKNNNLDLLRFLFASTVFLVHAHVLSGAEELAFLSRWLSSDVAVKGFFVLSGMLVFKSYEESRTLARYFEKRARRILPAYVTIVIVCAVLLSAVSAFPAIQYFSSPDLHQYLGWNLVFLNFVHPTLPGVFLGNGMREINGALWTLKIEVMFYGAVPLIVWMFRRAGRLPSIMVLFAGTVAYVLAMEHIALATGSGAWMALARQLPGQLAYFLAGACVYYYLPLFERRIAWFVAFAVLAWLANKVVPLRFLEPLWLGILVGFFGLYLPLGNFGKFGDFSYGIYIIHFPVLQVLVHAGTFQTSAIGGMLLATATVLLGAFAMWHLVEKPALRRGSHYIAATRGEP